MREDQRCGRVPGENRWMDRWRWKEKKQVDGVAEEQKSLVEK